MSEATFVADQRRPVEDFIALTGLKPKYANGCFERFGGYAPALASFAQSYAKLPNEYFDDVGKVEQNAELINAELRRIYRRARNIKHQSGDEDVGVWAAYYADPASSMTPRSTILSPKRLRKVSYCEPLHFTGPFLDMPMFWEAEMKGQSVLFGLDKRVIECNKVSLRKTLEHWVTAAVARRDPVRYVEVRNLDEKTVRLITRDANNTFLHPDHRKKFVAFLAAMYNEFEVYGPTMSFLAGVCMLVLSEEETATVLRLVLNVRIPPHWPMEVACFTTASALVESFLQAPSSSEKKQFDLGEHANLYSRMQTIIKVLCETMVNVKELFCFFELVINGNRVLSFSENQVK
ncbi:putative GTPase activating protein [Trypanosoma rangeli]|uniref:Putative GTPase activating protein n=1 Tax=Trypanosoma rangeli TaxID=5698 RepID=A0A422MX27_TRYRA|nr:putative GTPase activating protein [Trypanosoma rangeli]RNE97775.1 putative GTPase activating protein [Trypanosoma rangeli]|eukprot:RNE97775.1 putative GTPase activating protein [Trypanosoma rangeli]